MDATTRENLRAAVANAAQALSTLDVVFAAALETRFDPALGETVLRLDGRQGDWQHLRADLAARAVELGGEVAPSRPPPRRRAERKCSRCRSVDHDKRDCPTPDGGATDV